MTDSARTIVKVDGDMKRVDVDELSRPAGELDGPVALDLSELQSVDKQTQRVVFTVGDNKTDIVEIGLYNLTKDESPLPDSFRRRQDGAVVTHSTR